MRLAIISTILHHPWGGPDKRWTALAEACRERGDEVLLAISPLTAEHPRVQALVRSGARLWPRTKRSRRLGKRDEWSRLIPWLKEGYLETELEKFRPNVVFILQGGTTDTLSEYHLMRWLWRKKVPYVLSCSLNLVEEPFSSEDKRYLGEVFHRAAMALFMSTENAKLAEEKIGIELPCARIIQNPLDLEIPPQPLPPARLGSRPRLGFVGRIDINHKGLDFFMEALARVSVETDLEFHLTGRMQDPEAFRSLVAKHGLTDRVFAHGPATGEELAGAYRDAELMVLPSRWEGCASTMVEAMMFSRPLLVTPVGGVADWLTDGVNAFVASEVSVDAIEKALRRAMDAREAWPAMGMAAREAFEAKRDTDPIRMLVGVVDGAWKRGIRHTA
jgi:glycosyltransferase involved in cell wall biosynthesis